jgi:threonine/homoserine/homoserine lactone efflux protein
VLGEAIGNLLPAAVGVALSPIPIVAVVLMLSTPRARANGSAFAVGWVLGLLVVSNIVLVVASGADDSDSASSTTASTMTLLLGLLFFVMAARQWRSRPAKGEEPSMPGWVAAVDHFKAPKSFALGVALSALNPKNLALTVAAAASIAQEGLSAVDAEIAAIVFVVIGSLSVVGPVVLYLVAGARVAHVLTSIKDFMIEHNAVIMMVVLLVLGAKLLGNGVSGLTD